MGVLDPTGTFTDKQVRFIEVYCRTLNAAHAAREAGYQAEANVQGCENLAKPHIKAEVAKRLAAQAWSKDDIISRLKQQAQSLPIECFKVIDDKVSVDMSKVLSLGYTHLIKKIGYTRNGSQVIEWHDPQRALELLGKAVSLFTEDQQSSGKQEIVVTFSDKPNTNPASE